MSKNWTGNSKSVYTTLGASNHVVEEREINDYYATHPKAAKLLLEIESLSQNILEPSVGEGHLADVLKNAGKNVTSWDIIDRGYPDTQVKDFLKINDYIFEGDIVMNPPYKSAKSFIEKALDIIPEGNYVFAFLKVQFMESKGRKQFFLDNPPKTVWVSSTRIPCAKNGDFEGLKKTGGSAISYCWYVWEKGFKGETTLKWFN